MFQNKNLTYLEGLELPEWIGLFLYVILILTAGWLYAAGKRGTQPIYRYYFPGLLVKLLGAVAFCLVYIYYYKGGDTIAYYESARAYVNLLNERPFDFIQVYMGANSLENYYVFDANTGYPWYYMYTDTKTLFVIKFITPFVFVAFKSYLLATLLLSLLSFAALWSFFRFMCGLYTGMENRFFYTIFLIPSAVFWGSGILKDTLTLTFSLFFIVSFYQLLILKKISVFRIIAFVFSVWVIFSVKPYILLALAPGAVIWLNFERIKRIGSPVLRVFLFILFSSIFLGLIVGLSSSGYFSVENLLSEAAEKQRDLQGEHYQGSGFNIGYYDPSIAGALSVAPKALVAALFSPFIFEARNVMMLVSGIENLFFFGGAVYILLFIGIRKAMKTISSDPVLIFFLVYVILLGLIVGLSTSNFGALVRFKVAYIIEWALLLILVTSISKKSKKYST